MLQKLSTATDQKGENSWNIYPRPQLRRNSYVNLNGQWDFCISSAPDFPTEYTETITVPFCPESVLSGLEKSVESGSYLFYRRELTLPADFNRGRVLLHIGAADQVSDVYVNHQLMGHHEGG